jgi:hypothetical protein
MATMIPVGQPRNDAERMAIAYLREAHAFLYLYRGGQRRARPG